jgi:hypothetical protein
MRRILRPKMRTCPYTSDFMAWRLFSRPIPHSNSHMPEQNIKISDSIPFIHQLFKSHEWEKMWMERLNKMRHEQPNKSEAHRIYSLSLMITYNTSYFAIYKLCYIVTSLECKLTRGKNVSTTLCMLLKTNLIPIHHSACTEVTISTLYELQIVCQF